MADNMQQMSGLTPLDLQSTVISELKSLFDGQVFLQPKENETDEDVYVPLNFYPQALPQKVADGLSYEFYRYMPYICVELHGGKQEEEAESELTVTITIGVYDNNEDNQGHIAVTNIIETIWQYFFLKRVLNGKYFIKLPFEWQLNEEDVWPYFFGSIETHWNMPLTEPDDPNL